MTITLDIPTEIAAALEARAATAGQDVASLVKEIVVETMQDDIPVRKPRSPEEFMARLQVILKLIPQPSGVVDDSRESIYAGRGE